MMHTDGRDAAAGLRRDKEAEMKAAVGDRLVIKGHRVGTHTREATIVEVRGSEGEPPYVVHWEGEGESEDHLFFPGPDAEVEHIRSQS